MHKTIYFPNLLRHNAATKLCRVVTARNYVLVLIYWNLSLKIAASVWVKIPTYVGEAGNSLR